MNLILSTLLILFLAFGSFFLKKVVGIRDPNSLPRLKIKAF